MKILQIGKFFPPYFFGGIETVSCALHEELQKKQNVKADFIGFLPKKYTDDIQVDEHVYLCKTDIDKFSAQLSKSFFRKYKNIRNNYDIIIINMPHPVANMALWLYRPKKNVKVILYWHSDIVKQKKLLFFYKPFQNWLINRADAVIAPTKIHTSESDCRKLFQNKKFIYNIPYILRYENHTSKYKLTDNGKKVIFACGRLIYYKGFNVLIDAAKYISDDVIVHISGTGKLHDELKNQIDSNGLQNKVKLLGRLSDEELKKEYENCYIYCFPSTERGEMMGMVQFEALSYGKPIISTNIPRSGAPTLNIEGVTGFKVPVYDSKSLAEKINTVVNDSELYEKLCKGAEQSFKEYNESKIIEKYITAFEEVLKG